MVCTCPDCGALFAYNTKDIYENCFVYCPVCHARQKASIDLSYDGVIKTEQKDGQ